MHPAPHRRVYWDILVLIIVNKHHPLTVSTGRGKAALNSRGQCPGCPEKQAVAFLRVVFPPILVI